jgi:hypothetical protein
MSYYYKGSYYGLERFNKEGVSAAKPKKVATKKKAAKKAVKKAAKKSGK